MFQTTSERLSQAILRAEHHWEQRRRAEAERLGPLPGSPTAFTIAVSRAVGARGTSVARELGRRLNWPVYDNELVQKIAHEMGLRASLLESIDERHMGWLEECVASFATRSGTFGESGYVRRLVETILSLGLHGECVIVGRGAAHILPPATTLRVRLIAERADRIHVLSSELGISGPEAARRIDTADQERNQFIEDHFGKDPSKALFYDLVLNTSRFPVEECVDLIIEALRRLQKRAPKGT